MSVLDDILGGVHDDDLDQITEAITDRRKLLTARKSREFVVGTRVVFNSFASPKYIQGLTGVVTGMVSKQTAEVRLDEARGRFPADQNLRAPLSIIDLAS